MTRHGENLFCDTEDCKETTSLTNLAAAKKVWYFTVVDGKFVDYCAKHHPMINRTPPGPA